MTKRSGRLAGSITVVTLLALGLAACGGDDEPDPATSTSTSPTTSPTTSPSTSSESSPSATDPSVVAGDALSQAQDALDAAAGSEWKAETTSPDGLTVAQELGSFVPDPPAAYWTSADYLDKGPLRLSIAIGSDYWAHLARDDDDDLGGCWAHKDFGDELLDADLLPDSITLLLSRAELVEATPTELRVKVDLWRAINVFPESLRRDLRRYNKLLGTVPATFTIADGMLTGYRIELADVVAAADAIVPQDDSLDEIELTHTVTLSQIGTEVNVSPPSPDYVVEVEGDEGFIKALKRCGLT